MSDGGEARSTPVVSLRGVSKTFGTTRVLEDFELDLRSGEVVAVVGQNGSGKSTMIKILAGYHRPDPGASAKIRGEDFQLGDAAAAKAADLRFVHQDLALVPSLSAIENFALTAGYLPSRGGIRWAPERQRVRRAINRIGFDFNVDVPVGALAMGEQVGLAIARALARTDERDGGPPTMLLLDEPTACLPASEVASLFRAVRAITDEGVPVIYVSHRLDEVFELANRVLVLRDGRTVANEPTGELTHDELITLMLGQETARFERELHERSHAQKAAQPVLTVRGLAGRALRSLDLAVGPGRVVGIAGVTGSGREEVGPLLGGEYPRAGGDVQVLGVDVDGGSPGAARKAGIGYLPSDRKTKAVIPQFTVAENLTLLDLRPFSSQVNINGRKEIDEVMSWIGRLDVRPPLPGTDIAALSGGNQQKVILGRLVRTEPSVIVLDEPTQGVDVGAKAAIHGLLRAAAGAGAVVVVCSSDTEELVALADEVIVLQDGVETAHFSGDGLTDATLDRAILGGAAA